MRNGSVRGLCLVGNARIDLSWREGEVSACRIKAKSYNSFNQISINQHHLSKSAGYTIDIRLIAFQTFKLTFSINMSAYLFVHFKEKRTPDGEQVYFGISRDGFHWESVNGGNPV